MSPMRRFSYDRLTHLEFLCRHQPTVDQLLLEPCDRVTCLTHFLYLVTCSVTMETEQELIMMKVQLRIISQCLLAE